MASKVKLDLRFEISNLSYHGIDVHIASNSYFGGLWGHGSLQTASLAPEVKFDLKFEISNLIYPGIHVHVASNSHFGGLWGCGGLKLTSEATYDLKFELSDPNYLCWHVSLASRGFCELIKRRRRRPIRTDRPACFAAGKNVRHPTEATFENMTWHILWKSWVLRFSLWPIKKDNYLVVKILRNCSLILLKSQYIRSTL